MSAYYDNFYKDDVILNNILKIADKNKNNVIISDLRLLEHIYNFYPNITTIASAVQLLDLDTSLSYLMSNTFDYIVLQTKYNNQLESIASCFKDRIVILPNDCCPSDCPLKKPCYERSLFSSGWSIKNYVNYHVGFISCSLFILYYYRNCLLSIW